ncbi:galactose oxidase [Rhizodiscina lignyota]|uniref:Galactose oxidase n=1 Tax=Rhizodiscina lignyota TaxID=1504668 RepID=A0A9P4IEK8_9PEZI|nr:galactose oxidase [Rhizodiscina lignyota]
MSFARGWYDPASWNPQIKATLTMVAGAPFPRVGHSLAVVKGRAYIFGGERNPGQLANNDMNVVFLPAYEGQEVDYTSIPARSLESGGAIPAARKGHVAVVIGDAILIFGGELSDPNTETEKEGRVWIFDTSSNAWTYLDPAPETPYPAARHGHAAASSELPEPRDTAAKPDRDILPQQPPEAGEFPPEPADIASWGTLFIYGGMALKKNADEEGKSELLNDAWAFDLRTKTWYPMPPPPGPARTGASLVCVGNTVWRFGGFDGQSYIGDVVDKLDVSGLWSFGSRGSALGELAFASGLGEWESSPYVAGPIARADAGAVEVVLGGRGYVALVGGQGRGSKGKGKETAEGQTEASGEDDSTRVFDDIWTFRVQPLRARSTQVKNPDDEQQLAPELAENSWSHAEYQHIDNEGDVKKDDESIEVMNQFRSLRRRAGFAAAKGSEIEGSSFVVWGGVDGRGAVRSDGYMVTIET